MVVAVVVVVVTVDDEEDEAEDEEGDAEDEEDDAEDEEDEAEDDTGINACVDLVVVYFLHPAAWRSVRIEDFFQSCPTAFLLII